MANSNISTIVSVENKTQSGLDSARASFRRFDNDVKGIAKTFDFVKGSFIAAFSGKAIQSVYNFGKACVDEFSKVEKAQMRLAFISKEMKFTSLDTFISSVAKLGDSSTAEITSLVSELAMLGKSQPEIEKLTLASNALAEATGGSLSDAFKKLQGTYTGSVDELGKLIPELRSLSKEQLANGDAITIVNEKFGKFVELTSESTTQQIKNFNDSLTSVKASFGEMVAKEIGPAIKALDDWIKKLKEAQLVKLAHDKVVAGTATKDDKIRIYEDRIRSIQNMLDMAAITPGVEDTSDLERELAQLRAVIKDLRLGGGTTYGSGGAGLGIPAPTTTTTTTAVTPKPTATAIETTPFVSSATGDYWNRIPSTIPNDDVLNRIVQGIASIPSNQKANHYMGEEWTASKSFDWSFIKSSFTNAIANSGGEVASVFKSVSQNGLITGAALWGLNKFFEPILNKVGPEFELMLNVTGNAIGTLGGLLADFVLPVLPIITYSLKSLAVVTEILISPLKWLADLFKWVGSVISTFAYNIIHPFKPKDYASFSSDAFTGLDDRIRDIWNSSATSSSTSGSGSYSGGSASYTAARDITININFANSYVNGDAREIARMLRRELQTLEAYNQ